MRGGHSEDRHQQVARVEIPLGERIRFQYPQGFRHQHGEADLLPDQNPQVFGAKPAERPPAEFVHGDHKPGGVRRRITPVHTFGFFQGRGLLRHTHLRSTACQAVMTSTPASRNAASTAGGAPESVTNVSTLEIGQIRANA
jgi:hypothetical protein